MADNKIMEELFKTIDIITSHKLYLTEYVYTEDCVIVSTTGDPYIYNVIHQGQEFEAYSPIGIKYNLGQSVVVLFTDYSKITRKIILYGHGQSDIIINTNIALTNKFSIGATTTSYTASIGGTMVPSADNAYALGAPAYKWSVIYSQTGSINTSDENDKEEINFISDQEKIVAIKLKSLIKKYKFKEAVEKKGENARIHFGIIAQDVSNAFKEQGLDPNNYGIFCEDFWYEKNGKILNQFETGSIKKIRLGIRYEELLCFIISAL